MPHDQDPRQWEKDIETFEKADARTPPPARPILFVGSSSIRFWRLKKYFPDHYQQAVNRGFGGSGLPDLLYYFDRLVLAYRPRAVVLYSGENDLGHGANVEKVSSDFRQVADLMRSHLPHTQLLLLPIKPSPTLWGLWPEMVEANRTIEYLATESRRIDTIDTAIPLLGAKGQPDGRFYMPDQLHLSQEAYALWSDLIHPWISRQFSSDS